jgi:hypothetical protein
MKITKQLLLPLALLFMLVCARGQDIHYNYDRGANFAVYKTYQWVDLPSDPSKAYIPNGPPEVNLPGGAPPVDIPGGGPFGVIRGGAQEDQLTAQAIKRAIDEQLAQKGLTKVERGGDIQVVYQAAIHQEKSLNLSGMGWGGRGSGWWDGSVQGQTSTIPIGTIAVDLYDPARKQLIWRGDATKTIDLKKNPDNNYKTLQKAMSKLFKNYPPQPDK